jgi:hypothetical protein
LNFILTTDHVQLHSGSFIVDAVDYFDSLFSQASLKDGSEDIRRTRLIITADCTDPSFVNMMRRFANCALLLVPLLEPLSGRTGISNSSYSNTDAARGIDSDKGVKMIMKQRVPSSGLDDKVIFSHIRFSDGKLLCNP